VSSYPEDKNKNINLENVDFGIGAKKMRPV
jgi:hypothetical protein